MRNAIALARWTVAMAWFGIVVVQAPETYGGFWVTVRPWLPLGAVWLVGVAVIGFVWRVSITR